jgi:predicted RNA-binding protein YlqC (UPF0109 family)
VLPSDVIQMSELIESIKKTIMGYYSQPQYEVKDGKSFYRFYDSYIKEINVEIESQIVNIILTRKGKRGSQMGRMIGKKGKTILPLIALIEEEFGEEWTVNMEDEDWKKTEFWRDRIHE